MALEATEQGAGRTYRAVPPQVDLPAMEREVLEFWRERDIFARSVSRNEDADAAAGTTTDKWTFYEGPPTANGRPGTHHVESRTFKDIFPRFKTMQGRQVSRKGGWDCHGLPVELAVEKELGFSGKADIEAFGIAEFNARCRESVLRYVDLWEQMTERMGCWIDMREPYRTMDPEYIDSEWWALKQIHSHGLLVEDYRVAPYCPRCGTALSDHELAQGYETVTDPSVYVRFPLTSGPHVGADLLVWTTTPWTLVSNALVAVHPEMTYVLAVREPAEGVEDEAGAADAVVVAESLWEKVLGEGWTVTERFPGTAMVGWTYQRPFELVEWPARTDSTGADDAPEDERPDAHFVVTEDYVTAEDGTGLVHQSPAFGEDDFWSCRRNGVAMVNPITPQGAFEDDLELVGGQFFRHANTDLVEDLQRRGLLFRHLPYEHTYPHCWRCHTALLYYAQPSWYIRTTAVKDELLRENEATTWYPATIKHGRYGDWLENNIDWALSRSRYWGTPLPIWRCPEGHQTCVGSRAELTELTGADQSGLDPHRPYVDEVTFACPRDTGEGACGLRATRVPEVIDAWFDSGSMPFAQWGYPHLPGSEAALESAYPADFICEAIDQTRGWFYSLMAVGTLVFDQSSYRNVLCLGHILAEDGRKMSKHLGNILEPIPLMDEHGADAVRWFMAAGGSPWAARRVGHTTIQETVRKVLLTYWNTVAFQVLYANLAGWTPTAAPDRPAHVLDRWALAEAARLVEQVTAALEDFDTQRAGSLLAAYVDDLSNWYVRRSRRRFWNGDAEAFATLHECLVTVTQLMAPMAPFITERVWRDLVVSTDAEAPESVHLSSWPTTGNRPTDPDLAGQVALARRLVELGRAARADAKVRTRQPLGRALIGTAAHDSMSPELRREIAEELNVGVIEPLSAAGANLVEHTAKGNFRALGKRFAKDTPRVAAAIAAADAGALAATLREQGRAEVQADGSSWEVLPEEVIVSERPREGWSVVNEQGETIALDLEITPDLRRAGLAREVVRLVQEARKGSGLEVSDRIELRWSAGADTAEAIRTHAELIASEVLATRVEEVDSDAGLDQRDDDLEVAFSVRRV